MYTRTDTQQIGDNHVVTPVRIRGRHALTRRDGRPHRGRWRRLAASALLALGIEGAAAAEAPAQTGASPEIRVYSAGSLRGALTTIAHAFARRTGARVVSTYGSSGLLRERIQHGADADVFTSADMGQPRQLAAGGAWSQPVAFARNDLCVLARKSLAVTSANLLRTLLDPRVRIGTSTPGADPSGDYAWEVFHRADRVHPGAYATLSAKAMQLVGGAQRPAVPAGQNPVVWFFAQGKIDTFLSYCGGARKLAAQDAALTVVALPSALAVAGTNGVTVRDAASPAAHEFAAELRSPAAQAVLRANGFRTPSTIAVSPAARARDDADGPR